MRDKQDREAGGSSSVSSNTQAQPSPGKATLTESAYQQMPSAAQLAAGMAGSATSPGTSNGVMGGFAPGLDPKHNRKMVGGGRSLGEAIGDAGRVAGTALGNVVGGAAAVLTGVDINSSTTSAPAWGNHGQFSWQVGFTTTGKSGFLVQEVINTYRAQDAAGTDLVVQQPTPQYWEAWAVDAASAVTPAAGGTNDFWLRPDVGTDPAGAPRKTQGHWSMQGKVYFTTTDPTTQGLTPGGVPDAGILLSGTAAPGGLGIARLHRYAQGTWDSTGATPTHTGSAH
jgi:hypothetical protein